MNRHAKHTPGPWIIAHAYTAHVQTRDGYAIHDHPDYSSITDEDEIAANTRLIAAAPELLKALKTLVDDFADYPASARPCHAFDLAAAALAKALGDAA